MIAFDMFRIYLAAGKYIGEIDRTNEQADVTKHGGKEAEKGPP